MILSRLDVIVRLGVSTFLAFQAWRPFANEMFQEKVLLEGLEWGTSEDVDKLKKMLWGLEDLRVFDGRLSA